MGIASRRLAGEEIRQALGRRLSGPLGRALARTGLSPDWITGLGFLGNLGAAALLGLGWLFWAGWLVLGAAALDMLDGAVARAAGKATTLGAFLDSTLDRLAEAAIFAGLLAHLLREGSDLDLALLYAAAVGSLLVSYLRARAEGLGLSCRVGLATRPERVLALSLGLLAGQVRLALWVLAVAANFTVLQRLVHVARQARAAKGKGAKT